MSMIDYVQGSIIWKEQTEMDAWLNFKGAYNRETDSVFRTDLLQYIMGHGIKRSTAEKITAYAWMEGHSSGYNDVIQVADDIIEIVTD